jgi:hypothetical protein
MNILAFVENVTNIKFYTIFGSRLLHKIYVTVQSEQSSVQITRRKYDVISEEQTNATRAAQHVNVYIKQIMSKRELRGEAESTTEDEGGITRKGM